MSKWDNKFDFEDGYANVDEEDEKYFAENGRPIRFLKLYNFITDSSELIPNHKVGIYKHIYLPMRGEVGYWINLVGYASKIGNAGYNKDLSLKRCQSAQNEILSGNNGKNKLYVAAFRKQVARGEEADPNREQDDAGVWRSVRIYVHRGTPPPKPPSPKPVEPPKKVEQHFAIRLLGGQSVSLFKYLGRDAYVFEIKDKDTNETGCFAYNGTSGGASIGGLPFSFSGSGPFADFTATSDTKLTIQDFDDVLISLNQEPGASFGKDSIRGNFFLEFGSRVDNPQFIVRMTEISPSFIKIASDTGLSLSPGVSKSFGRLHKCEYPKGGDTDA